MSAAWVTLIVVLWTVVAVLIALVLGLTRRVRELSETWSAEGPASRHAPERLTIGGPAIGSQFELSAPGEPAATEARHQGHDQVVLFLSSSCGPCRSLGEELVASKELDAALSGVARVLVTDEEGKGAYGGLPVTDVMVQRENEISRRLGINATPFGIATDSAGTVRWAGIPQGVEDVFAMAAACSEERDEGQMAVATG